jgi:hypothetical protein
MTRLAGESGEICTTCGCYAAATVRALVAALMLIAAQAQAQAAPYPEIVVVASSDEGFSGALEDALAPTGMRVIRTPDAPPPVGELSILARRIAERERAVATVWLVVAAGETTLVTYDLDVDRVLVRDVPYTPPLRPAQAAEVARMARSMLRSLRVTPELDLPVPRVEEARVERERVAEAVRDAAQGTAVPRKSELGAWATAGVRVGAAASDVGLEGRVGLGWRPDRVGVDLAIGIASRAPVETMGFAGRVADDSVGVTVHAPLLAGAKIHVAGQAGLAMHAIAVDGRLGAEQLSVLRINPAMRVGLVARYELGRAIDAGFVMSSDGLLRRQRYESSAQEEILIVPRIQATASIVLTLRLL